MKLLTILPGLVLVVVSVLFVFGLVRTLLLNQALLFQAVIAGLMLAFVWHLYSKLPHFLRRSLARLFRRSHREEHHDH